MVTGGSHANLSEGSEESIIIDTLPATNVSALVRLEQAAWPGSLQASERTIRDRFDLGHVKLVARSGSELLAAACFVPTREDPRNQAIFPRDFRSFSSLPATTPVRSLYTYNLCVHPDFRGGPLVRRLISAVIDFGIKSGATWLVGDGRCPSYAGSRDKPEDIAINPTFASAIDEWRRSGRKPSDEVLISDPLLRFYCRTLGCEFLHLMPDFLPEDRSSGGYRVIFAKKLHSA